ncbi:MAG TPA: hypothetical protein VNZ45_18050, partial [Bacteroidia bacterium]|nr:hypothetical protein [Bacteroidia bacterium]
CPLWIGCDLTVIGSQDLATLSNSEVIAIDQDPLCLPGTRIAHVAAGSGFIDTWVRQIAGGGWCVCLLNRDVSTQNISVNWSDFGATGPFLVRDLWAHQTLGMMSTGITASVPTHDVAMYLLGPALPIVLCLPVTNVTASTATLNGFQSSSVTVEGFNYGLTPSFGSVASISGTFSAGDFSIPITGLSPGTTYYVQAFATNASGSGLSLTIFFTTVATPPAFPCLLPFPGGNEILFLQQ